MLNIIPSVKHGGGSIMLGPVLLHLGQDSLPSLMEQWILNYTYISKGKRQEICLRTESQENVGHAARQQPQAHKSFHQRMSKENKVNVLERLSQSPDLNPIQMLWKDLSKQFIGGKWFCTNRLKLLHVIGAGLISIYKKLYLQLLQQKRVTPDTESKDSHTCAILVIFLNK